MNSSIRLSLRVSDWTSRLRLAVLILLSPFCLLGCGGGGGGGGGSSGGGGDVQQTLQLPSAISISMAESGGGSQSVTAFSVYAPTDDAPSNFQVSGTDAAPFIITISVSNPPSANGLRTVQVNARTLGGIDFERPTDANHDNVYEIPISCSYRGSTLSSTIKITITDINDAAAGQPRYVIGETVDQQFGSSIARIPDITGDGKSELAVNIRTGRAPASAYILSSEFLAGLPVGATSVSTQGSQGARFLDATPSNAFEANLLSTAGAAANAELLLSDIGAGKSYLFTSSLAALRGDINPDAVTTGKATYASPANVSEETRLIGDVNGDGIPDILALPLSKAWPRSFGIIFGRTGGAALQTTQPDLVFTFAQPPSSITGANEPTEFRFETMLATDVDGDHFPDLLIAAPDYGFANSSSDQGALWLIRSAVLRGPPATIDLDAVTSAQGARHLGRQVTFMTEVNDFDSDGLRTLGFTTDGGFYLIDGDDFLALPSGNLPGTHGQIGAAPLGSKGVFLRAGLSGYINVGDIDGDGLDELSDGIGSVQLGSRLKKAMTDSGFNPTTPGLNGVFSFDFRYPENYFGPSRFGKPVFLPENGLIAVPYWPVTTFYPRQDADQAGRILFIRTADIAAAIAKGVFRLEIF